MSKNSESTGFVCVTFDTGWDRVMTKTNTLYDY